MQWSSKGFVVQVNREVWFSPGGDLAKGNRESDSCDKYLCRLSVIKTSRRTWRVGSKRLSSPLCFFPPPLSVAAHINLNKSHSPVLVWYLGDLKHRRKALKPFWSEVSIWAVWVEFPFSANYSDEKLVHCSTFRKLRCFSFETQVKFLFLNNNGIKSTFLQWNCVNSKKEELAGTSAFTITESGKQVQHKALAVNNWVLLFSLRLLTIKK